MTERVHRGAVRINAGVSERRGGLGDWADDLPTYGVSGLRFMRMCELRREEMNALMEELWKECVS